MSGEFEYLVAAMEVKKKQYFKEKTETVNGVRLMNIYMNN